MLTADMKFLTLTLLAAAQMFAQGFGAGAIRALPGFDLSGNWAPAPHEENTGNPALADYLGVPINETARAWALAWDPSRWTVPEHQCQVHVAPYIYGGPLNLRIWEEKDPKALELREFVEALKLEAIEKGWIVPKGVYQFFKAQGDGDKIRLFDAAGKELAGFRFPRQSDGWSLCLSDFVHPDKPDHVALFCVTSGTAVRAAVEELKAKGEFLKAHALAALALETAEALAELCHKHLRLSWGVADPADLSVADVFKAKYRGIRVSFGYPACPRLEDQTVLFDLLKPESIGVELTEGFMMDPEGSVSALVFHHPQGRYFTISQKDLESFEKGL